MDRTFKYIHEQVCRISAYRHGASTANHHVDVAALSCRMLLILNLHLEVKALLRKSVLRSLAIAVETYFQVLSTRQYLSNEVKMTDLLHC